jgi:hypothetical protein
MLMLLLLLFISIPLLGCRVDVWSWCSSWFWWQMKFCMVRNCNSSRNQTNMELKEKFSHLKWEKVQQKMCHKLMSGKSGKINFPVVSLTLQTDSGVGFSQSVFTRANIRCKVIFVEIPHSQIHLPCKRINHRLTYVIFLSMIQFCVFTITTTIQ